MNKQTLILSLVLLTALPALAHPHGPAATPAPASSSASAPDFTEAEVRKVDAEAGKLTLRHAEIKHLDMPPMTMVFAVRDKALLKGLKVGDKLQAQLVHEDGRYLVIAIKR